MPKFLVRGDEVRNMKRLHMFYALMALLLATCLMAPTAFGQSLTTGDISGTVTDPMGAVLANAAVTLTSAATGEVRTGTTNSSGSYRFSLLKPGSYTVGVTAPGFTTTQSQYTVNVGQATVANVKLTVGRSATTVEVTGAPPLVQTETANLSTNFDQAIVQNAPNGGNDLSYIAQTSPGAVMNAAGGYGNFSVYGLPATANLFTVNGENDMDPYLNLNNTGATNLQLGKNDLQEVTVISNAYSGQYGQQAGAQVNYVTKSGTNQFHGDAIYYWNGSSMNANGWFNNVSGVPKPFANNNQWAAGVGGPIKKDKLFFYANTEGLRFVLPSSGPVFAWSPNYITNSLAAVAVTNPVELPLYQRYYNLFQSAPGYPGAALNTSSNGDGGCGAPIVGNCIGSYQANAGQLGNEYIVSGRVDYNLSDKDQLFWRVRMDRGTQPTTADFINPAFSANSFQPSYDGQGQWSHVFSPNATNQFVYAGSYYRAIFTQNDPGLFPYTVIGSGFNLTRVGGLTYDFPQGRNVTQYQFVDDFSWTKGNHSLKFGANFRRYDISDYVFSVLNNPEVITNDPSTFFSGDAHQTRQRFPTQSSIPVSLWGIGLYAQDEWRATKNLMLTFALRGEHNSNPVCRIGCGSLLNGSFNNLLASGAISDSAPYNSYINANRHSLYSGVDTIDWGPRVGFAWSPYHNDKTVVRGGFGIFYDALAAGVADDFMLNIPNVVAVYNTGSIPWADTTTPASPYILGANSAAAIKAGFANGASYDTLSAQLGSSFRTPGMISQTGTFKTPYYEQWSIGIQQALGDKSALTLNYVGNHGVHIPVENPGLNTYGVGFPPYPNTAPTNVFTTVAEYYSGGISNYNGLTATYTQRMAYGFTIQANYTWSHAMDEISNGGFQPFSDNTDVSLLYQINPSCLRCNNYGNADYNVSNYFSATYVWMTPWKFGNRFVNGAIGGWTISQNFFARVGLPFTVLDYNNFYGNFTPNGGYNVASVIQGGQTSCGSQSNYVTGTPCLNANNFYDGGTNPFPPSFPNQRRNQYRGPGFFDSDLSVNKNFKLTERVNFGVGANFYNVFNHPNFDLPDNGLGDSTFGQTLTMALPPTGPYGSFFANLPSARVIQFQGKLTF